MSFILRQLGIHTARASGAAVYSFTIVLAVLATVLFTYLISHSARLRWDLTAAGERQLATRTKLEIARLDQPHRLVIIADASAIDSSARRRTSDVLREIQAASSNFSSTFIDVSTPSGIESYRQLLWDLTERDAAALREQTQTIELSLAGTAGLGSYLSNVLSPALVAIHESLPPSTPKLEQTRQYFQQAAARARLSAQDLLGAANDSQDFLRNRVSEIPLPLTDRAARSLTAVLGPTAEFLASVVKDLTLLTQNASMAGPAAEAARAQLATLEQQRSSAAVLNDTLRRMQRLELLRIVDVLASSSAALLIGPAGQGLVALDLAELYPLSQYTIEGTASADMTRRVEDLIATALSALRLPDRPLVVLVHAEARPFLNEVPMFQSLISSLRMRGIEVIEWATATTPEDPSILRPAGGGAVVYVSLAPDSSAAGGQRNELSGTQRAERLGEVLLSLAENGKSLLISLNPSVIPSFGQTDPLTNALAPFGLSADTGRPLLRSAVTPRGPAIESDRVVQPIESAHVICGAVRGLPTLFPWPIGILQRPVPSGSRVEVTPLYSILADEMTWAEAKWLRIWQTPREQRPFMTDLPAFDAVQDARWPTGRPSDDAQPWNVALAAEKFVIGQEKQRLIVVGSNSWFLDQVAQQTTSVDGRVVRAFPGNFEFFEAAVWWLAVQDELIAQSPTARAVSIIQPMSPSAVSRLRLLTIGGIPTSILLVGLLLRLIRR